MSSNPPQIQLSLPTSSGTNSFKRSFEQFGFDIDAPDSAESGEASGNSSNGGSGGSSSSESERKRARGSNSSDSASSPFAGPPRIPTPDIDVEMSSASSSSSGSGSEEYRLQMERFNAFDRNIDVLRRTPTPPPTLPPLALEEDDGIEEHEHEEEEEQEEEITPIPLPLPPLGDDGEDFRAQLSSALDRVINEEDEDEERRGGNHHHHHHHHHWETAPSLPAVPAPARRSSASSLSRAFSDFFSEVPDGAGVGVGVRREEPPPLERRFAPLRIEWLERDEGPRFMGAYDDDLDDGFRGDVEERMIREERERERERVGRELELARQRQVAEAETRERQAAFHMARVRHFASEQQRVIAREREVEREREMQRDREIAGDRERRERRERMAQIGRSIEYVRQQRATRRSASASRPATSTSLVSETQEEWRRVRDRRMVLDEDDERWRSSGALPGTQANSSAAAADVEEWEEEEDPWRPSFVDRRPLPVIPSGGPRLWEEIQRAQEERERRNTAQRRMELELEFQEIERAEMERQRERQRERDRDRDRERERERERVLSHRASSSLGSESIWSRRSEELEEHNRRRNEVLRRRRSGYDVPSLFAPPIAVPPPSLPPPDLGGDISPGLVPPGAPLPRFLDPPSPGQPQHVRFRDLNPVTPSPPPADPTSATEPIPASNYLGPYQLDFDAFAPGPFRDTLQRLRGFRQQPQPQRIVQPAPPQAPRIPPLTFDTESEFMPFRTERRTMHETYGRHAYSRTESASNSSGREDGFRTAMDALRHDGLSASRHRQLLNRFQEREREREDEGQAGYWGALRRRATSPSGPGIRGVRRQASPPGGTSAGRTSSPPRPPWRTSSPQPGNQQRQQQPPPQGARRAAARYIRHPETLYHDLHNGEHSGPHSRFADIIRRRRGASGNMSLGDYVRDADWDDSYESLLRLTATIGDAKPKATPNHIVAGLDTAFYKDWAKEDSDKRCPICLDDYKALDPVLKLRECSHWLHKGCLEQWLKGASTCPVCRESVTGQKPGPSSSTRPRWNRAPMAIVVRRRPREPPQTTTRNMSPSVGGPSAISPAAITVTTVTTSTASDTNATAGSPSGSSSGGETQQQSGATPPTRTWSWHDWDDSESD